MQNISLLPTCINAKRKGVYVSDEPVLKHIKDLCANKKSDVVDADSYQYLVAPAIERLVIVAVDLDEIFIVSKNQR